MSVTEDGMHLEEVLTVLRALEAAGIAAWLEGGWGVDALTGRQTRPHRDLDIDIDMEDEARTLAVLAGLGYEVETDWRPTRVELVAVGRGWVDVHPLQFDATGDARQAAPDGTYWHIPRGFFGYGLLGGRRVRCYSVEAQRLFHRGYALRPQDLLDMHQLDLMELGGPTGNERSGRRDRN